ncbi:MAG: TrkH family potassium uptake protein [Clostridia bacterium]|nr:TrkH family potassium uptake protein [Clostridia bacterium]
MGTDNALADKVRRVKLNPSQALVAGFAAVILLGGILLSMPVASNDGHSLRFLDAIFTATSATCVTGLVVVDTATQYSVFGQVVIMLLIQVGGLGFMALATMIALVLGRRITLRGRLFLQESLNQFSMAGLVRLTQYLLLTTFIVEGVGAVILTIRFSSVMPLAKAAYFGVFHAVSAFCNAGFDLFGIITGPFTSLTSWEADPTVVFTICSLIILGGLGFPVIIELVGHKHGNRFSLHTKLALSVTALLLLVGIGGILVLELTNPGTLKPLRWDGRLLGAIFQSVTPRTAGFNTLDIGQLRHATLFLMVVLMFIGASPSSTGGGIKTTTFGVLLASIASTVRGYDEVELYDRRIPRDLIMKAITIATLALALVSGVTMILSVTEQATFLQVLFETTSAFGTVGLTMGITPDLTDIGRILIIATMFMGRVGPLTVMVALAQRKKAAVNVHLAEEKVLIG